MEGNEFRGATTPYPSRSRDLAVEGLRGLAAVMVFYHHLAVGSVGGWSPPKWTLWPVEASAAVMIFFLLSGYVIGLTYQSKPTAQNVRAYAWRRIVRLLPMNFIAVFLSCALATSVDWGMVLSNLFFLQNYSDYAGVWVLVLDNNPNLWSLNYEVLYYLLFVLIWVVRPALKWVGLLAVIVLLLGWYTKWAPVFLACYAAGFLFWLAGFALAWRAQFRPNDHANWPSCLLLALITWKFQGLRLLLSGLPAPSFAGPVVRLYALDFLPVSLWLLATIAQRTFPGLRWVKLASVLIPAIGLIANWFGPGGVSREEFMGMCCAYALAVALWRWRPSLDFFRRCAPLGLISFALYALAYPIQDFVYRHGQWLPPNAGSFGLCAVIVVVLSFGVAWYVERRIQPEIQKAFSRMTTVPRT